MERAVTKTKKPKTESVDSLVKRWMESDKDLWSREALRMSAMVKPRQAPGSHEDPRIATHRLATKALAKAASLLSEEGSLWLHGYAFHLKGDERLRWAFSNRMKAWQWARLIKSKAEASAHVGKPSVRRPELWRDAAKGFLWSELGAGRDLPTNSDVAEYVGVNKSNFTPKRWPEWKDLREQAQAAQGSHGRQIDLAEAQEHGLRIIKQPI